MAPFVTRAKYGSPVGAHGCLGAGKRGRFPRGAAAPEPQEGGAPAAAPRFSTSASSRGATRGGRLCTRGWGGAWGGVHTRLCVSDQPSVLPGASQKSCPDRDCFLCVISLSPPSFPARGTEQVGGVGEGWVIILPRSCMFSGLGSICTAGFSCGLAQKTHFSFLSWDTFEKLKYRTTWVKNEQQRERNVTETKLTENTKWKLILAFLLLTLAQGPQHSLLLPFLGGATIGHGDKPRDSWRESIVVLHGKMHLLRKKE